MTNVTVTRQAVLDEQFEVGIFEFSDGTKMYWTAYGRSDESVFVLTDGAVANGGGELPDGMFDTYITATENADNIEVNWMTQDEMTTHEAMTGTEFYDDRDDDPIDEAGHQERLEIERVNAEAFDQSYTSDAWLARQEDGACGVNDDLGESPDF